MKYNKGEDKEVAYSDATKADFAFNPSLDTALTEGVSKVDSTGSDGQRRREMGMK